jgi:hypothetical protein
LQKIKCEEILMNWKTLLVIASLSLSAGLTACNKEAAAPDATKTDTTTPAATETKPADGAKDTTKTTKTETTETKPADAMKGAADGMKGAADGVKGAATDGMKGAADGAKDAVKSTTTKTETTTKPATDAPKKP